MSTTPQDNHQRDTSPHADPSQVGPSSDPAQIEADIARHRAELTETVDELTGRLDVKKQAQHKVESVKKQAADTVERVQTRANAGLGEVEARLSSGDRRDVLGVLAPAVGALAAVLVIIGVVRRVRR